jgi:hypothetical protein
MHAPRNLYTHTCTHSSACKVTYITHTHTNVFAHWLITNCTRNLSCASIAHTLYHAHQFHTHSIMRINCTHNLSCASIAQEESAPPLPASPIAPIPQAHTPPTPAPPPPPAPPGKCSCLSVHAALVFELNNTVQLSVQGCCQDVPATQRTYMFTIMHALVHTRTCAYTHAHTHATVLAAS